MILRDIFIKPVDRPIEGVIKADDEASLRQEVEEYVLTHEVEKRLELFLDAYNNYQGANGVWLSGFFGSGKSHLLKMLALLLENRQIDGKPMFDMFLPKCGDNEILRADLTKAISIPSKSILFNIDQKADVISKTQIDALLAVFVKVFDEMCGYYGKQPYIAQFERELDKDGLLDSFKKAFETEASNTWDWGRSRPNRVSDQVDAAYNQITGQTQRGILDKYRQDYRLSIEDFAEQINTYVKQHASSTGKADFRLNFFVDEVGQYIADNVKLMTNLQTIAESLATKCRGRAWVIVTAQEDMATVLGEMGKQQGNDFSKIQDRFSNRLKLTSQNVDEVIQKRLLSKSETAVLQLSDIYHAQSNNFKTLFDFADGAQSYRNFQDKEHFIHCYPFIPYQFSLFQAAIQSLSQHNAFEGKHSSVGERSMLGVFQQVAIHLSEHELGELATFDLMFEGIRTALKANIQRAVIQAENHLGDQFAIRVLKALFLVKYVKEFKSTTRNICVLMLDRFDSDLPALRKRVEQALNLLEQQTYIQRNGELYDYLTDEEKDVEQEIKNTEVEASDISAELEKIIFDQIIKDRKIRFSSNGGTQQAQDYIFTRKLDDRLYGREYELAIHVISPFHEHAGNDHLLQTNSTYKADELFVILPPDDRLMRDLLLYKQTEKYIRQNISVTQQEAVKRILNDKGFQNRERSVDLIQKVQSLIGKATLLVAGSEIEVSTDDAQTRIIRAFHDLVTRTYPNLRMLRGIAYTEEMVKTILSNKDGTLFGGDATTLAESEQDVLAFVHGNNRSGVRSTIKGLLEKFERKPYGWPYAAILCTLASLCARGKIEVRSDSNLLEEDELERAIRNTHGHGNIILEPQVEFTASQMRGLKEFYEDFFDTPPKANEAKALGKETGSAFSDLLHQLSPLVAQVSQYPFLSVLGPVQEKVKELASKPYTWYLTELPRQEDELLALKEQTLDPVRKFMSGPQKSIFDETRAFVQSQEPNFAYVDDKLAQQLARSLHDSECFKGNAIQQMKTQLELLMAEIQSEVVRVRESSRQTLIAMQAKMHAMDEYIKLPEPRKAELDKPVQDLIDHIRQQHLIAVINDRLRYFEDQGFQKLLTRLAQLNTPQPKSSDEAALSGEGEPKVTEPKVEYVHYRQVRVVYDKAWLADESDVDRFLESMREAFVADIKKGKRIQV